MQNDASARPLDIDAVRAFALVAELQSFTRAAQVSGTTQSAVSLKLKRLEDRLTMRLVERTPRSVRLTVEGVSFLERARDLLAAHDRALAGGKPAERRLTVGISDHVAGPGLAGLISRVNAFRSLTPARRPDRLLQRAARQVRPRRARCRDRAARAQPARRREARGGRIRLVRGPELPSKAGRGVTPGDAGGTLRRARPRHPRPREGQDPMARSLHRRRRHRGRRRDQLRPCGRAARAPHCAARHA